MKKIKLLFINFILKLIMLYSRRNRKNYQHKTLAKEIRTSSMSDYDTIQKIVKLANTLGWKTIIITSSSGVPYALMIGSGDFINEAKEQLDNTNKEDQKIQIAEDEGSDDPTFH